jgi:hypothetical protein
MTFFRRFPLQDLQAGAIAHLWMGKTIKGAGSVVLHFADDFGSQAFHLLGLVEE